MSSAYKLQYYHSYDTNESILGSYCCQLQDGGVLIARTIQNGVCYTIRKDNKQRELFVKLEDTSRWQCIGIAGYTIADTESLILLLKEKSIVTSRSAPSCIMIVSIKSSSDLNENDFKFPQSRCRLEFTPTCMVAVDIAASDDSDYILHFLLMGRSDGDSVVYNYQPELNRKLIISKFFIGFFPHTESPLLSIDFYAIDAKHRLYAFGYASGLVCIYSISGITVTEKLKSRPMMHEYDPLEVSGEPITDAAKNGRLVLATHLSSPVHVVKLLVQTSNDGDDLKRSIPHIDFIATCYEKKAVCFVDILRNGLASPSSFADLSDVSCINCIHCNSSNQVFLGDLSNRVILFHRNTKESKLYFPKEEIIAVNDSVYSISTINSGELIVNTRRGIYIFQSYNV